MKKTFLILFITILFILPANAQIGFSPKVDSIIQLVTTQTMSLLNRQISGDTAVMIGGNPYTIATRYWGSASNPMAAQWIKEKLQSFGLSTRYQNNTATNINVIATKLGIKYPNKQYIICGHYDDMPSGSLAPGADDNGSGTCAVIEAARLLANLPMDYTVIFIAFDEEERGLYGSKGYADTAYYRGDSIMGVINLDMIAWDSNNDWKLDVHTNNPSMPLADDVVAAFNTYVPIMLATKSFNLSGGSDHQSFWTRNYKAILGIETMSDFNAYYHTVNDNFSHVNVPYFVNMTKGAIASLLSFVMDYRMSIVHTPIVSNNDITNRIATAVITSPKFIKKASPNNPRLYYKINNGSWSFINSFYNNGDTFKFSIPGQPLGTTVNYYIAAQDSTNSLVGTLPAGGKGINPPGTIAPPTTFVYQVANIGTLNLCSTTLPKPILDLQNTYDTITVNQNGNVLDINVNITIYHTYDSDMDIYFIGNNNQQIELSTGNGSSGDNYINTTFDDEAITPIQNGTAPFTGSYKPEQVLSTFDGLAATGKWVLRVYDKYNTDQGTLVTYCITMQHSILSGIPETEIPLKFNLSQNYPNPFNGQTRIEFSMPNQSDVKIVLYDILGREVRTMIDSKLTKGEYSVIFKDERLASGIYFYTMFVNGQKFETRKMILSR